MNCSHCEKPVPEGSAYCPSCNVLLPESNLPVEEGPAAEVNERYLQLKDAGEKVLSGEISVDAYRDFLDQILAVIAEKESQVRDLEIPPEVFEDFRQEIEAGFAGIEALNRGVGVMRQYVDDPDPAYIHEGVEIVRSGSDALNEAMRINRENQRKLKEAFLNSDTTL
ncbi:MAG: zinc ribbon domain-containing protein [Proteobacteria bacterium]|nr:zinc ribbon domain-containing protein [Pseudomonadota bacterium]